MADSQRTKPHFNLKDLTGQVFGKLTVLRQSYNRGRRVYWTCRCECGLEKDVAGNHLTEGATVSCGCFIGSPDGCVKQSRRGLSVTREYAIWRKMLDRCFRPESRNYPWYGGVGHYVCKRWKDSFDAFLEDMGTAPTPGHQVDRINTLGSYTCGKCDECKAKNQPANCRWATKYVQVRNAKNNLWFTHDGRTLILKDWARLVHIDYHCLYFRIFSMGLSFSDAISLPPQSAPFERLNR